MPYLELTRSSFAQSGKSFEEILFQSACGGPAAVRCYLQTRRSIFLRDAALRSLRDDNAAFRLQVLAALDRAIELLPQIQDKPAALMQVRNPGGKQCELL
ncbi:hypothetical protein DUT91_23230 [Phyllobacterium salinisoli]|uniref:Uncharacterized protein n=1 Tax=Phyllobacterium salinisoli TaxID=1899321 RepID=A0A368JYM8_9HYPH|nr:hypothetical protein DUT91_23230 [Phyllobacterium salinisoli]